MQLLLQHQQHQLQQLHAMQQQQSPGNLRTGSMPILTPRQGSYSGAAATAAGVSPPSYYGGGLLGSAAAAATQSPQSPRVLSRRTGSYNRCGNDDIKWHIVGRHYRQSCAAACLPASGTLQHFQST
jgi:hypothetical protein